MASNVADAGPVKSTLDHVVDKLAEMNKDQTTLQEEAILYSNELQEYVQNEGHTLSNAQLIAMNELILSLREGRLDDIEASKEELLRRRAEEKRDETRNDHLKDVFKQLKKQYKWLKKRFKEDDGMTFMGLVFRTALVGFLIGVWKGFTKPYLDGLKKLGMGVRVLATNVWKFFHFDKLFNAISKGFNTMKLATINWFQKKFPKMFTGKGGFLQRILGGVKNIFKDLWTIAKGIIYTITSIGRSIIGLFTGSPLAFKQLAQIKFSFDAQSKLFQVIGKFITWMLTPLRKIKGWLGGLVDKFWGLLDKLGKSFDGTRLANFGTTIKEFFKRSGPLARFFALFESISLVFVKIGQVFGRFLWPLFAIIGAWKGASEDMNKEADTFNNVLKTMHGMVRGAFRFLIGDLLDILLIDFLGWIVGWFSDSAEEKMHQFSFADWFDSMFYAMSEFIIETINIVRDMFKDIGFGGMIANMVLEIGKIFSKIADWTVAVAKGGWAAIKDPFNAKEAFLGAYQDYLDTGGMTQKLTDMQYKADGKDKDGKDIEYLSDLFNEGQLYKNLPMVQGYLQSQGGAFANPSLYQQTTTDYAVNIIGNGLDGGDEAVQKLQYVNNLAGWD